MGVMGLALRSPTVAVLTEVDCVVVSYNSAVDLLTCIDSLTSQEGISARVVVVDNLSSDDSVGTARQLGSAVIVNDSNRGFARYHADDAPRDQSSVVDWVSGSCMLLPRRAWESVGGFDKRYFMYVRDMDLCFRLRRSGWKPCTSRPRRSCTLVGSRHGIVRSDR